MPTMSPAWMLSGTICSSDSSTRMGSPADCGVAAASTKSQRGVMTAVPKELSLGLTRWTLIECNLSSCEYRELREHIRNGRLGLPGWGPDMRSAAESISPDCIAYHKRRFRKRGNVKDDGKNKVLA